MSSGMDEWFRNFIIFLMLLSLLCMSIFIYHQYYIVHTDKLFWSTINCTTVYSVQTISLTIRCFIFYSFNSGENEIECLDNNRDNIKLYRNTLKWNMHYKRYLVVGSRWSLYFTFIVFEVVVFRKSNRWRCINYFIT